MAANKPISSDGSLMVKTLIPKTDRMPACRRWYGRCGTASVDGSEKDSEAVVATDFISADDRPAGVKIPAKRRSETRTRPIMP